MNVDDNFSVQYFPEEQSTTACGFSLRAYMHPSQVQNRLLTEDREFGSRHSGPQMFEKPILGCYMLGLDVERHVMK